MFAKVLNTPMIDYTSKVLLLSEFRKRFDKFGESGIVC